MSHWTNIAPAANRAQELRGLGNLFLSLAARDIRARYRRTLLGPLWAILPAILTTAIFSFLNRVVNFDSEGAPYIVFAFAAIVPWTYFQSSVVRIPHGVLANSTLIRKMSVPRLIFPLVVLATTLFDFLMSGAVLLAVLLIYGVPITAAWLWLPILLLMLSALACAVGIGISAISVYRRDLMHGMQHVMQLWLFATPVFYSARQLEGGLQVVYQLNPAVGIIDGFRRVLVFGQPPNAEALLISLMITLLGLAISLPLFQVLSQYFADVL